MRLAISISVITTFALLAGAPEALAQAQPFGVACNVKTLCVSAPPGPGRIVNCLRDHYAELSDACFAAFGRHMLKSRAAKDAKTPATVSPDAGAPPADGSPPPATEAPK